MPMPQLLWSGFSRSWEATPCAKRSSSFAIVAVSTIWRLPTSSGLLDDLDPVAVRVAHEAEPVAALADRVRRTLRLDPLRGQVLQRAVHVLRCDGDVSVPGADVVGLVAAEVERQLQPGIVAVL